MQQLNEIPIAPSAIPDYQAFEGAIAAVIPEKRLIRDALRKLTYGTDASFYRLIPKLVAIVDSELELRQALAAAKLFNVPVTFRAAGTSLSGQAVTDSVLLVLGDAWGEIEIAPDAQTIRLGPGVLGSDANRKLAPLSLKIGPDPASINACKIGGIAANNASGMCCGTAQNSYNTLRAMRVVLADGAVLDTGDAKSREAFERSHGWMLERLRSLAEATRGDAELAERIRRKFAIKNTTGYSLNALVDFEDPFEILQHLMIGSEGTLGFISSITYQTVPEYADKASALLLFPNIDVACRAVVRMKPTPVSAVELIDRASLRSIEHKAGIPPIIRTLGPDATALLVETRAESGPMLQANIAAVTAAISDLETLTPVAFTDRAAEYESYWNIRKGLFPSIGGMRPLGTTVVIEDVAFPIARLAEATADLQRLFTAHGYADTILFGHALEGNLHFVITPQLNQPSEVDRYRRFMDAVTDLVVHKYDGSLKAEHGTGRNMAPFVELEWGAQAYRLMRMIKDLFDPEGLLNPGVILNDDPDVHVKNLKPLPAADPVVDTCMECGFCEHMCPSQGLTLTPRHRIVAWREISRRVAAGENPDADGMRSDYDYFGIDTCAADGMCAVACPVAIETGELGKKLRSQRRNDAARTFGRTLAGSYGKVLWSSRQALQMADLTQRFIGPARLEALTDKAREWSGGRAPVWRRQNPTAVSFRAKDMVRGGDRPKVVYLPSCASRTMGPSCNDPGVEDLPNKTAALLVKAGYDVIFPQGLANLCCGQPFESKGLFETADAKSKEVGEALDAASEGGRLPVVSDTSPCSFRLKKKLPEHLRPLDISEFLHDHVLPKLTIRRSPEPVALHVPCSSKKMGLAPKMLAIAKACAEAVIVPEHIECCGWAGDKGWTTPELNEHALRRLKEQLPPTCGAGYSNSRTCEIGLAIHSERPYRSIVYLVDAQSEAIAASAVSGG